MKKAPLLALLPLLGLAVTIAPRFLSDYYQVILVNVVLGAIMASGFRLIFTTSRLTMGHVAFVGLGAYTSAFLSNKIGLSFWLGMPAGGIMAMLVAVGFGYVVMRVAGIYFALITLAFSELLVYVYMWGKPVTGGMNGLVGVAAPKIGGFSFRLDPINYYYVGLGLLAITLVVMYRIEHSRIGIAFHSLRQNPELARHIGVNPIRYRVLAFASAAFFAGMAGSLQAHFLHYVGPNEFTLMNSLYVQVFAVVGGLFNVFGPLVGAFFVIFASDSLRIGQQIQPVLFGGVLILFMLFVPRGLVSLPGRIVPWARRILQKLSPRFGSGHTQASIRQPGLEDKQKQKSPVKEND